ncbi:MAG: type 4a pilus biogenesis protein PilO [Candidatus Cloacimonas sp.]|nr:type 4a pilus biogenesis protein PilO [Candidatus Cloacimonadota bacterium]
MKERYLILLGVVVVVALFFFYSANSMLTSKTTDISRVDRNIRRAQERLNSAKVLDDQLSQVSKVIDNTLSSEKGFTSEEVNEKIKVLAELADTYQIAVFSLLPRTAFSSSSNQVEHNYVMDIMSTYVQLGKFLAQIEKMDNIVKINTLDVKAVRGGRETDYEEQGNQVTQYRVVLELSVFKIVKEA